jgi:hypothetical protein
MIVNGNGNGMGTAKQLHVRAHAIVIGYLGGWQMDRDICTEVA